MHMADALLSVPTGTVMWVASVGAMAYSVKKIKESNFSEKKLPIMAVSGAFVFAAQMINFTIPATGSSGHIGGGILLAALLGEFPALLTIGAVLMIQCLFFADGGLLALGANIFNMGVIPCFIAYPLIFKPLIKKTLSVKRISIASFLSAVVGLQIGAFCVVLETLCSGITELPFSTFVILMQPIHLAIGAAEGVVTAAVVAFVYQMRPEIIESSMENKVIDKKLSLKSVVAVLVVVALLTGGALSLFASSYPDGLEWSIENTIGSTEIENDGVLHNAVEKIQDSIAFLPDYDFQSGEGTGTSIAGIVGSAMTCVFAFAVGGIIIAVKKHKKASFEN